MASTEWPDTPELQEVLEAFRTAYQDASHGTRVTDIFHTITPQQASPSLQDTFRRSKTVALEKDVYNAFVAMMNCIQSPLPFFTSVFSPPDDPRQRLSPHVCDIPTVEHHGVLFGTRDKNIRNSFICFKDPCSSDPSLRRAGQISRIFLHSRDSGGELVVEPFLVVDQYAVLSPADSSKDPYLAFPLLETWLCYDRFSASVIIRRKDIISHFAAFKYSPTNIDERCVVVRCLDRVRASYILPNDDGADVCI